MAENKQTRDSLAFMRHNMMWHIRQGYGGTTWRVTMKRRLAARGIILDRDFPLMVGSTIGGNSHLRDTEQ